MLRAVHAIETCLVLPQDQVLEAMKKEATAASQPQVRRLHQALALIQMKLRRDAVGLPGPDAQRQVQDFFLKIEQGRGSESDVALCSRMVVAYQLSTALQETYSWLNQPVSPAEENRIRLRESLTFASIPHCKSAMQAGDVCYIEDGVRWRGLLTRRVHNRPGQSEACK